MKKIILSLFITLLSIGYSFGQGWGEWQHYSYITNGNIRIMKIEYKTYYSKNYYPKVKWKATNLTGNTYYDFGLGSKEYTFANGTRKTSSGEGYNTMKSYETESFVSDSHCCDGNRITRVKLNYVKFRTNKNGERYKINL